MKKLDSIHFGFIFILHLILQMDPSSRAVSHLPFILQGKLFIVTEFHSDQKITAQCCQCKENDPHVLVKGATNNTYNFWRHYQRHHKEIIEEFVNLADCMSSKRSHSDEDSTTEIPACKKMKLCNYLSINAEPSIGEKQQLFDDNLLKYIINSMKPYNTVDDEYFRKMIQGLDPRINIVSRRTLCRRLKDTYEKVKSELKDSLKLAKYLTSTADIWSTKHRSFLGVTIHYIDENTFERCSNVLACRRFEGRHTFDRIAIKLHTIYEEYQLSHTQVVSTITDNAKNFVKAFQEFGFTEDDPSEENEENMPKEGRSCDFVGHIEYNDSNCNEEECEIQNEFCEYVDSTDSDDESLEYEEVDESDIVYHAISEVENCATNIILPKHLRCASHKLNLISTVDFAKFIKNNSEIHDIHHSVTRKCQKLWKLAKRPLSSEKIKKHLGCNLKYPTLIRWNAYHDSLGDIVKHKSKLKDFMKELQPGFEFTDTEMDYLEELHELMEPIAVALDILQSDTCYYGDLLPILFSLRIRLYSFMENGLLTYLNPLVPHLLKSLNERFGILFSFGQENSEALAASSLLPHYKLDWLPDSVDDIALESIKKIIVQACENCITDEDEKVPINNNQRNPHKSFIILQKEKVPYQSVAAEFDAYLKDSSQSMTMLNHYPRLKKAFLRYNTSICSSAPVERLFSTGGVLLNSRRCSLSDKFFEIACILKSNPRFS